MLLTQCRVLQGYRWMIRGDELRNSYIYGELGRGREPMTLGRGAKQD